jgi:hypothetical protein
MAKKVVWEKDEDDTVKLDVNQILRGKLVEKIPADDKHGCLYRIEIIETKKVKSIWGTTILDRKLMSANIGELIYIRRLPDVQNKKGQATYNFETGHGKETEVEEETEVSD